MKINTVPVGSKRDGAGEPERTLLPLIYTNPI